MTKEKEAMEVQLGESGEEVKLAIVEEASPANAAAQQAISELARAKTPLEQLVERIDLLEQRGKIQCIYSCTLCPSSFVERIEELEERSNGFNPAYPLSVTDARQIQISLTESIKLSLGHEAFVVFKLVRYNISAKWNDLSYVQASVQKIGSESPLYKEFSDTYKHLHRMAGELDEPLQYCVSQRDGSIIAAKRCYNNIFYILLNNMKQKVAKSLAELTTLVAEIHSDLTVLFGEQLTGTLRLAEWLQVARNTSEECFRKHKALSTLRRFYPFENEIDRTFYVEWGLESIDKALKSDVGMWEEEESPAPVQKKAAPKISQSYFKLRQ
ncbi:unnamed protein product [Oikopleura dioica]|uniref:Uncharacterized protein n=1 Tax=Oikopleura dioica TaxID=34765 RepID=E4XCK7_OIKDI|nr:unnamed protein product [Oikopleura dioica]